MHRLGLVHALPGSVGGMSEPILDGIKVVDMTQYLAGPTVTRLMAELGADVVKVEQAPHGDPSRGFAIINDGRSGYYVQQNRGKRSLCLDFDDPAGREVLDRLLAEADVFVENYGPGVLERRGLDWETLSAAHPRLIMASVSGYGREASVHADRTAFDLIAQAQSGIMHVTGDPDGPPMPVGSAIGDVNAGVHAVAGVGMALFHRERTGRGQWIDISMVDALFHMHEMFIQGPSLTGYRWKPTRAGHQSRLNAPHGVYKGPEGWIVVQVMERQWPGFCRAIGRPELEEDERFVDLAARQRNRHELNALIEEWMASHPDDDAVMAALESERVPSAKVLAPADADGHPHFESRGSVRHIDDPVLGAFVIPGNPIRMSAMPDPLDLGVADLGEHNAEVLAELGYGPDDVERLESEGVLRTKRR